MKIQKKSLSKKKLSAIIAILVLVVGIGVAAAAYFKVGPFSNSQTQTDGINFDEPTQDELDEGKDAKDATVNETTKPGVGSDQPSAPIPNPDSGKSTVGSEITSTNQNGSQLQIRTLIQAVTSEGTCILSMEGPSGKTYSQGAGVQALPSASTCKGFDVPVNQLSSGPWKIQVVFENATLSSTATSQVTIK